MRSNYKRIILFSFLFATFVVGFQNCGNQGFKISQELASTLGDGSGFAGTVAGQEFFKSTVVPEFQVACHSCHQDQSNVGAPTTIYDYPKMVSLLFNSEGFEKSALLRKVTNQISHFGKNQCQDGGNSHPTCQLLKNWFDVESKIIKGVTDPSIEARFLSVSGLGVVSGYAMIPSNPTAKLSVIYKIANDSGSPYSQTVTADGVGQPGPYQGHYFEFTVPDDYRIGQQKEISLYVDTDAPEKLITGGAIQFIAYKGRAIGKTQFDSNVANKLQACASCHSSQFLTYDNLLKDLVFPLPAKGGTATNNRMFRKPSNNEPHTGGALCSPTTSPCTDIQAWWTAEFGP